MNVIVNAKSGKLTSDTGNIVKEPQDGMHYVSNIFLKDQQFAGTFPTGSPIFDDCSCQAMQSHIDSGLTRKLDDLPMGGRCQ
jgi:hypothetical protein